MDIQVVSDLHLEEKDDIIDNNCRSDILFLAGDIGHIDDPKYADFVKSCSKKWRLVISVLGNNEYYSASESMEQLYEKYKALYERFPNTFLLEKRSIEFERYKIIGATTWGNFFPGCIGGSPRKIKIFDEKGNLKHIGHERLRDMHAESKEWILKQIDDSKDNIIVTHFPLTLENEHVRQMQHREEDRKVLDEFGCELQLSGRNICCISGHTHHSHDFIRDGTRYISNQKGYDDENGSTNYNASWCYTIFKKSSI
tara:strand:- start:2307 stop:3071 length:765 start_codon:yes stop_codon:yes gene_type:complete